MPTLLMLKGLPASGKSTYAKELVNEKNYFRVNKDDLRSMINNNNWTQKKEKSIIKARNALIEIGLATGRNVVVDDTNFHKCHENDLRAIAKENGAQFKMKFIEKDVEQCILDDLKRPNSVGKDVIMRMYNQFLKPKKERGVYAEQDKSLPKVYLCDLDGCLSIMKNRSPYDMSKVGEDKPHSPIVEIISNLIKLNEKIIFFTARNECARKQTENWLKKYLPLQSVYYEEDSYVSHVNYHGIELYMRDDGDSRKDSIVKKEMYEKYIKGKYFVKAIFDDRNQVVEMWRNDLNLPCLQVADGDF